jgi:conjugative relaxase-like TrwC/TraI family protein
LKGRVAEGELARLFDEGRHPSSAEPLGFVFRDDANTVTSYGLTFSAPKSVSVLWGLGDERAHAEARAAHEMAVRAAIGFLDEHAAFSRRGKDGVFQVDTDGLLAAEFCHGTSRSGDPQLHTHVLVSAKCRGSDGRWRSLDGRELFAFKKAAGVVYQAALRAELTTRLGVAWQPVDRHGQADLVGIPNELVDRFSQRRRQVRKAADRSIADWEARLGRRLSELERSRQFQLAAYATRPGKSGEEVDEAGLRGRWRAQAAALGLSGG